MFAIADNTGYNYEEILPRPFTLLFMVGLAIVGIWEHHSCSSSFFVSAPAPH